MRIALVTPYTWTVPSGVNYHVMGLRETLERRGHEVWVIAPAGTVTRWAKSLPEYLIPVGSSVPVKANGSVAYANAWPFMMQRMGRVFARHHFDLVHVHEPTIPSVGAAATMVATAPVVGTFHAGGEASGYYERWRPLAARILASISTRIAVSEAARDCVASHFPDDYILIPNGIDLATYAPARDGARVPGRILFVGRPDPRKGLPVLLEAFSRLHRRLPGVSLDLIGPTEEQVSALLPEVRSDTELRTAVRALGRMQYEAKVDYMREAEIMCAPSLGGESFGIILTEAMAASLPIVASNIDGYRTVLADGAVGVLVPPGDSLALCDALFSTLQDHRLRASLARSGLDWVQQYSWEHVADQVAEAYAQALCRGARVVKEPAVPALEQARHFARSAARSRHTVPTKPRTRAGILQ